MNVINKNKGKQNMKMIKIYEFLMNHPELPVVDTCHFVNYCVHTDIRPYLIVSANHSNSQLRIMDVRHKVVDGCLSDGSAKYEYFIDEDAYNLEKTTDFKSVYLIKKTRAKNKTGYHTIGSEGCYFHLATEPKYYYDPSF